MNSPTFTVASVVETKHAKTVQLKTMSTVDNGEALLKNVAQIGVRI
jgi:hypothetical protein